MIDFGNTALRAHVMSYVKKVSSRGRGGTSKDPDSLSLVESGRMDDQYLEGQEGVRSDDGIRWETPYQKQRYSMDQSTNTEAMTPPSPLSRSVGSSRSTCSSGDRNGGTSDSCSCRRRRRCVHRSIELEGAERSDFACSSNSRRGQLSTPRRRGGKFDVELGDGGVAGGGEGDRHESTRVVVAQQQQLLRPPFPDPWDVGDISSAEEEEIRWRSDGEIEVHPAAGSAWDSDTDPGRVKTSSLRDMVSDSNSSTPSNLGSGGDQASLLTQVGRSAGGAREGTSGQRSRAAAPAVPTSDEAAGLLSENEDVRLVARTHGERGSPCSGEERGMGGRGRKTRFGGGGRERILGGPGRSPSLSRKRRSRLSRPLFIEIEDKASEPPRARPSSGGAGGGRSRRNARGEGDDFDGLGDRESDGGDGGLCGCARKCLRQAGALYLLLSGDIEFSRVEEA